VQRAAKGWETELRIAYDDVISAERLAPLVAEFYEQGSGTRLRLGAEVLGGCWDALLSGRADLAIGAPSDPPLEAGYTVRPMGEIAWVFVAAASHPLASLGRPVSAADIAASRVVLVADSSRNLPPRSSGLAPGPDSLTVSTLHAKLEAQIAGLGVGFLPVQVAAAALADGRLVALEVEEPKPKTRVHFAWRPRDAGKALKWWVAKLEDEKVRERLLGTA
jgi:DNA-binding transcriptional LysR family regulator